MAITLVVSAPDNPGYGGTYTLDVPQLTVLELLEGLSIPSANGSIFFAVQYMTGAKPYTYMVCMVNDLWQTDSQYWNTQVDGKDVLTFSQMVYDGQTVTCTYTS